MPSVLTPLVAVFADRWFVLPLAMRELVRGESKRF